MSLLDNYENVQKKVKDLDHVSAEGAHVRSRIHCVEEGEMSSKFFLHFEKKLAWMTGFLLCVIRTGLWSRTFPPYVHHESIFILLSLRLRPLMILFKINFLPICLLVCLLRIVPNVKVHSPWMKFLRL